MKKYLLLAIICFTQLVFACDYYLNQADVPATLTNPNSIYCLTTNMEQTLELPNIMIAENGITLDCQGFSVITSSPYAGGYVPIYDNRNDTIIKNCKINSTNSRGILLDGANNAEIFNNNVVVKNGCLSMYLCFGIYLTNSNNNQIFGNQISSPMGGINLLTSNYNRVYNNEINSSNLSAINLDVVSETNITNNTILVPSHTGIRLMRSNSNLLNANNISASIPIAVEFYGVIENGGNTNTTIIDNNLIASFIGIDILASNDTSIINNIISNSNPSTTIGAIVIYDSPPMPTGCHDTFIWHNNITGTVWITNGGINTTFNDSTDGNIYYFASGDGSWTYYDIWNPLAPDYAKNGTKRPFNSSLTGGEWMGSGNDYFPWTENNHSLAPTPTPIPPIYPQCSSEHGIKWIECVIYQGNMLIFGNQMFLGFEVLILFVIFTMMGGANFGMKIAIIPIAVLLSLVFLPGFLMYLFVIVMALILYIGLARIFRH